MKNFHISIILIFFFLVSLSSYSQVNEDEVQLYKAIMEQDRNLKNEGFKNPEASPIPVADIINFKGLNYFEPDVTYKVKAQLTMLEEQITVTLNTTSGGKIDLIQYGTLSFLLDGKSYALAVFRDQNLPELSSSPGQLFIPFTDKTTGQETNDNGRYLSLSIPQDSSEIEIDFNKAMNPYSVYDSSFSSVIPPDENAINASMQAGERKYEDR